MRGRLIPAMWNLRKTGVAALPIRAITVAGSRRGPPPGIPAGDPGPRDQGQVVDALRIGDGHLAGDEAAHRVAHQRAPPDADPLAEVPHESAVGRDRDLPGRHRARAKPGQIYGDDAVVPGEVGDVLQEVLPGPREAVDEDEGRTFA